MQKLGKKDKVNFLQKKLNSKDLERKRSELNGRQLQSKTLTSFLLDTNEIY